jgi:hypothetical protein
MTIHLTGSVYDVLYGIRHIGTLIQNAVRQLPLGSIFNIMLIIYSLNN